MNILNFSVQFITGLKVHLDFKKTPVEAQVGVQVEAHVINKILNVLKNKELSSSELLK